MQTTVLYLCYIVLILLFSTAYNTSLIYGFVIWCLHTNKRRLCSSTLSSHPSPGCLDAKVAAHSAYTIAHDHGDNEFAAFAFNNTFLAACCVHHLSHVQCHNFAGRIETQWAAPGSQEYGWEACHRPHPASHLQAFQDEWTDQPRCCHVAGSPPGIQAPNSHEGCHHPRVGHLDGECQGEHCCQGHQHSQCLWPPQQIFDPGWLVPVGVHQFMGGSHCAGQKAEGH